MENQILEQILNKLNSIDNRFDNLESRFDNLEKDVDEIKIDVKHIKSKVDNVYDQTHDLTEFKTESNMKLDKISDDVEFIKHEEFENKQDLFKLKRNLKIMK